MQIEFYQSIPELNIEGRMFTPDEFNKIGLPKRLSGMTVLDVGCNSGAFMIECLKRGAIMTWGVEPDMQWRIVCNGIFAELKYKTHSKLYDKYVLQDSIGKITGKYDLVLLLSVLHLVEKPQELLNKVLEHSCGLTVVEINDRLQKIPVQLPPDAVKVGVNKDDRSVWHIGKLN